MGSRLLAAMGSRLLAALAALDMFGSVLIMTGISTRLLSALHSLFSVQAASQFRIGSHSVAIARCITGVPRSRNLRGTLLRSVAAHLQTKEILTVSDEVKTSVHASKPGAPQWSSAQSAASLSRDKNSKVEIKKFKKILFINAC